MALIKKLKKNGTHTEVTFEIKENHAPSKTDIFLLGDFNDWKMADPDFEMTKKGKAFTKTITLKNGKKYEFRYVNKNFIWFNDDGADQYVPSPFYGVDNCVIDLTKSHLPKAKSKSTKAPKKTTPVSKKGDDLKKIEGIGPKIAGILSEKGYPNFEALSKAKVKDLEAILEEAGPRYRMHKPGTWPQQAALAAIGAWDELKVLQDKLNGGK